MSSLCGATLSPCPAHNVNRVVATNGQSILTQNKVRNFTMTIGNTVIPLQTRNRQFTLQYTENTSWSGLTIVVWPDGTAEDCGTLSGSQSGSISENAVFSDSQLVYVDHINGIAMWRQLTETCQFNQTTSKMASFKVAYGGFYSFWFQITPVIHQVENWYLLVNGVKELVDTWTGTRTLSALNILWPLPPSLATPANAPSDFYDYYSDPALEMSDGGADFYYPSWLRTMGLNQAVDQQDASDRYTDYFLNGSTDNGLPGTQAFNMPSAGYAIPQGNAVKDAAGNILVSFSTRNKFINRLYLAGKPFIDLNTTNIMLGNQLKLYPVSLV
jgi:hypothetical protein